MKKTFRSIDEGKGFKWKGEPNPSALELWHMSILDTAITDLEMGDLCRAIRQNLYVFELLPIVIAELDKDVLAGFLDDGELLKATSRLPKEVWRHDVEQAKKMLSVLIRDKERIDAYSYAVEYAKALEGQIVSALDHEL